MEEMPQFQVLLRTPLEVRYTPLSIAEQPTFKSSKFKIDYRIWFCPSTSLEIAVQSNYDSYFLNSMDI